MNLLSNQDQEVHAVSQVKPKKAYPDAQAGTSSSQVASHELSTFSDASNPSFSLASATADAAGHSSIVSGATQVSFIFYFMYVLLFFFFYCTSKSMASKQNIISRQGRTAEGVPLRLASFV